MKHSKPTFEDFLSSASRVPLSKADAILEFVKGKTKEAYAAQDLNLLPSSQQVADYMHHDDSHIDDQIKKLVSAGQLVRVHKDNVPGSRSHRYMTTFLPERESK
jgi:hypothetical protein